MSKAFKKESDTDALEALPPLPDPLPPGVVNYITPAGAEAMRREWHHLTDDVKPQLARLVSEAVKSDLDGEEPALTHKRQLREVEQRIEFLSRRMQSHNIIDPKTQDPHRIYFGAKVTIEDEKTGQHERCLCSMSSGNIC